MADSGSDWLSKLPSGRTALFIITLLAAFAALGMSIYNYQYEHRSANSSAKERFTNGGSGSGKPVVNPMPPGGSVKPMNQQRPTTGRVIDGNDFANQYNGSAFHPNARPNCPSVAVPEAWKPFSTGGGPSYGVGSSAYNANYPDETSPNSLAAQATYGCAPDNMDNKSAVGGGCGSYALNADSLMPGSWRSDTQCPDGTDPNSQWTKYAPSRDAYFRYVTAAGSARLGVNTRDPASRITGTPLLLRSSTVTPLSHTSIPFGGSSLRDDVIAQASSFYPSSISC